MKTLKYFIGIALILLQIACRKDDDKKDRIKNSPPSSFSLISLDDNDPKTVLNPFFSWNKAVDPEGENVMYDLYLDENSNPTTKVATTDKLGITLPFYLDFKTNYYWKIVAKDIHGNATASEIRKFTTRSFKDANPSVSLSLPPRLGHTVTRFNGSLILIGGNGGASSVLNDVWSWDMLNWTELPASSHFQPRWQHTALYFNHQLWVIAGNSGGLNNHNDVWKSSDGFNWTAVSVDGLAPFSARYGHASVVFDSKMWVIGGFDGASELNDVWYSSDGINWNSVLSTIPFSPLRNHQAVVFDNKIWIIGGYDGTTEVNDVWYSSDGKNWSQAPIPPFSARRYHTATVFLDKIWVIGGFDGTANQNDIWYSTNGLDWKLATNSSNISARRLHTATVIQNSNYNYPSLVIMAGQEQNTLLNDIWVID